MTRVSTVWRVATVMAVGAMASAVSIELVAQTRAKPAVRGKVMDDNDKGLEGISVFVVTDSGQSNSAKTDRDGNYSVDLPSGKVFLLTFFEDGSAQELLEVKSLTTKQTQSLSPVVGPRDKGNSTGIGRVYNRLQAKEAVAVFAITYPESKKEIERSFRPRRWLEEVGPYVRNSKISEAEMTICVQKSKLVEMLVSMANFLE